MSLVVLAHRVGLCHIWFVFHQGNRDESTSVDANKAKEDAKVQRIRWLPMLTYLMGYAFMFLKRFHSNDTFTLTFLFQWKPKGCRRLMVSQWCILYANVMHIVWICISVISLSGFVQRRREEVGDRWVQVYWHPVPKKHTSAKAK